MKSTENRTGDEKGDPTNVDDKTPPQAQKTKNENNTHLTTIKPQKRRRRQHAVPVGQCLKPTYTS